ncbi:MAG TPA: polysaccharide deacetylase family protein [Ktedonobacterales bacterium]|jgi:polysaccharide deacetylase family sporulation protein PdaB
MSYRKHLLLVFSLAACLVIALALVPLLTAASKPVHAAGTASQVATSAADLSTNALASQAASPSPISHGNPHLPEIALTFDDGPSSGYTTQVLSVLRKYGVHATFFMLGEWVQRYPTLAQAVLADGHAVENHSWSHPNLTSLSTSAIQQQLANTSNVIQQTIGVAPAFFRPPYGSYNSRVLSVAGSLHLTPVLWDIDPRDWSRPGTSAIVNNVLSHLHNGAIILMHDGGGDRSQTVQALPTIIQQARARGYRFVTVPLLLAQLRNGIPGHPLLSTVSQQPGFLARSPADAMSEATIKRYDLCMSIKKR